MTWQWLWYFRWNGPHLSMTIYSKVKSERQKTEKGIDYDILVDPALTVWWFSKSQLSISKNCTDIPAEMLSKGFCMTKAKSQMYWHFFSLRLLFSIASRYSVILIFHLCDSFDLANKISKKIVGSLWLVTCVIETFAKSLLHWTFNIRWHAV